MQTWLFCVLLLSLRASDSQATGLARPQHLSLNANKVPQQLLVTWEGSQATSFDVEILYTELMEMVMNATVFVQVDENSGKHQWNWTSPVPLECTSLSVKVRSRDGNDVSEWSAQQILPGMDMPKYTHAQMYTDGRIVPVGSNLTLCCIVGEGEQFGQLWDNYTVMPSTMLSRRSYATTRTNKHLSISAGDNVVCTNKKNEIISGAVVFVGYPPQPSDLVCETHDLVSVNCTWKQGRATNLYGKTRQTYYTLNGRDCPIQNNQMQCVWSSWEGNWTLVAQNPLGLFLLTDEAKMDDRVRPVAPKDLTTPVVHGWNVSLGWHWDYKRYESLNLSCQVELTSRWETRNRTYTGLGLKSVVLTDLEPDEEYIVRVRCANFWKWGEWSMLLEFKTKMDRPEAPDIWLWMNSANLCYVLWKPLTKRESHGQISGYDVTVWGSKENVLQTFNLPQSVNSLPINVTDPGSKVMVTALNPAGASFPATIVVPRHQQEETMVSTVAFNESGFPLSWEAHANASCGYVVEWYNTDCTQECNVDWTRVAPDNTYTVVKSSNFLAGVRYTLSVYTCSSESPLLFKRWHGYMQEMAPSMSVPKLLLDQKGSKIQMTWDQIPLKHQRGFILGYHIYQTHNSSLTLLANITDPQITNHTVRHLDPGSYKFTIKAYTSAGEDQGTTASISLKPYTDWLILLILVSLGVMTCMITSVTILCYRKRKWVKEAFYPEIPEPKLPGDWSRKSGPLDVKASPPSVLLVENPQWEFSKALVTVPEEDEDEDVDSDAPLELRYYNHVVDGSSSSERRPNALDSSTSSFGSMDSERTDVTYTGIQTSPMPIQPQHDAPSLGQCVGGGYRPQMQSASCPEEVQTGPEETPIVGSFGGYQPQCSWKKDSPDADGDLDQGCMGSPTSVNSSQFLLPIDTSSEEGKEHLSSATTWFQSLLTGKP
ncbi:hypothetical protein UPYG_G00190390 [Umbra pygmaea]|uniref:Fibronectin type-III domain-containing protein n=1 Tax=Umbra pygmaea TaxID=75934 RepID=A0ABD0XHS0_UMBPY